MPGIEIPPGPVVGGGVIVMVLPAKVAKRETSARPTARPAKPYGMKRSKVQPARARAVTMSWIVTEALDVSVIEYWTVVPSGRVAPGIRIGPTVSCAAVPSDMRL